MKDNTMSMLSTHKAFRSYLVDELRRQTFGPMPQENDGERAEVLDVSPLQVYSTGVLFAQKIRQTNLEDSEEAQEDSSDAMLSQAIEVPDEARSTTETLVGSPPDDTSLSPEQEPINLANEFSPSAMGLSFRLKDPAVIVAIVSFGTYEPCKSTIPHPRAGEKRTNGTTFPDTMQLSQWRRKHHSPLPFHIVLKPESRPRQIIPIAEGLHLHATVRSWKDGSIVVSVMIVNEFKGLPDAYASVNETFFQISMEIREVNGRAVFLPIDRDAGSATDDNDLASMDLLYRHKRAFALGHGTAGDWNRDEARSEAGATDMIKISVIPEYELKPIRPRQQAFGESSLNLSMSFLSQGGSSTDAGKAIVSALTALAADYALWIEDIRENSLDFAAPMLAAANRHITHCINCHKRIVRGIQELNANPQAMLAFRLMNRAMLIQQFHSSILERRSLDSKFPAIPNDYVLPADEERKWYPFQLAFILMNIAGVSDSSAIEERRIVDLIWFPTGGGKTEAYLGLAAFTTCYERLSGSGQGTVVLMRYTLRLLTAQQFQRAASLMVSLEHLRREKWMDANLGESEISIGLWVGRGLSPNRRAEARKQLRDLQQDSYAKNPFQVLECPWCRVDLTNRQNLGYVEVKSLGSQEKTVRMVCPDKACAFNATSNGLPIQVIDDDIYDVPPTLLIGTVDKFAQLAWNAKTGRIFGIGSSGKPPIIVIQDELHLISGPLGTIVGLYETAIDRLCSRGDHVHKVVASTATIRRAGEQCQQLYARDTFEFPPQGIRAGDSYFAFEDTSEPGRLYVGFMGTAVKSHQTSLVRVCSPLLQSTCVRIEDDAEKERDIIDPYGTLVWYFNSLRELGHAATLCSGDIPEHILGLCHRTNVPFERRRFVTEVVELTSRRRADEIPAILQQLEVAWRMRSKGKQPIDVLLATNMIAVGVDVSRLGLIVMSGQPKGTSEYIQATSRIGRRYPGLVVTVYTQGKSRDRSHYERFVAYHQSVYRYVEPTSVTPFSPQSRDRGLRGVIVAIARLLAGVKTPDKYEDYEEQIASEVNYILERIEKLDPEERDEAAEEIQEWLKSWKAMLPPEYGKMAGKPDTTCLMYPYGSPPDPLYQRKSWPVMTSMRNVDGTSVARVLNIYDVTEDFAAEKTP